MYLLVLKNILNFLIFRMNHSLFVYLQLRSTNTIGCEKKAAFIVLAAFLFLFCMIIYHSFRYSFKHQSNSSKDGSQGVLRIR